MLEKNVEITLVYHYQKFPSGNHFYSPSDLDDLISYLNRKIAKSPQTGETLDQIWGDLRRDELICDLIINPVGMAGIIITLTPKGKRLAKQYNSKIGKTEIWCSEHKVILTIMLTVLGLIIGATTLAINISSRATGKNGVPQIENRQGVNYQTVQPSTKAKSSLGPPNERKEQNEPNTKRHDY